MKHIRFLGLLILFSYRLAGQQLTNATQYKTYSSYINAGYLTPSFIHEEENFSVSASYRRQWVNLKDGPNTQFLAGEYLFSKNNGFSQKNTAHLFIGGYLLNDNITPFAMTGGYGKIGVLLSKDIHQQGISLGINAGLVQFRIRTKEIDLFDNSEISSIGGSQVFPDFGIGIHFYQRINTNNWLDNSLFYTGLSIPQVMNLTYQFKEEENYAITRNRHYYSIIGWHKPFSRDKYLEFSSWLKYLPQTPINIDFNLTVKPHRNFWVGAGVSTAKALHTGIGLILETYNAPPIRIGYSYSYFFNEDMGAIFGGTHELSFTYSNFLER